MLIFRHYRVTNLLILCVSCLFAAGVYADNLIRINQPLDGNANYAVAMLKLALNHIDTPYKIEMKDGKDNTQARNIQEVEAGEMDIIWAATDANMEAQLLPIRIPLYKGLLGHRIFIIRRGEQSRFDKVKTLRDLQAFTFGQGTTWADTRILEANGLKVIKTMKYQGLFYMLDGARFDAFPRGVQEPWDELKNNASLNLTVEKSLMLVYKMPFYLFTSKDNKKLAADLERGFNLAIADGSFDKVFYSSPVVQSVLENAGMDNRLVFELKNPELPRETPLGRPELWLDLNEFKKHAMQPH